VSLQMGETSLEIALGVHSAATTSAAPAAALTEVPTAWRIGLSAPLLVKPLVQQMPNSNHQGDVDSGMQHENCPPPESLRVGTARSCEARRFPQAVVEMKIP